MSFADYTKLAESYRSLANISVPQSRMGPLGEGSPIQQSNIELQPR